MKDLNRLLKQSEGDTQDQLLKKAVNQMLDQDLKNNIVQSLEEDYNVSRTKSEEEDISKSKSTKIVWLKRIASIAALFLLFFTTYYYLNPGVNVSELADKYAYQEVITHTGLLKGENTSNETRNLAIKNFNEQNWAEAVKAFNSLTNQNAESLYYAGMALFYSKDYPGAIAKFKNSDLDNSTFDQEVKWFLGLAYILNKDEEKGKEVLKDIKEGEWNYEKARELLK